MRLCLVILVVLLASVQLGCVGHSVGDIERQCVKLDDPDPARRMQAMHWFDDLSFWKYTSAEVLAAPSLAPCVVKTARLMESRDRREALEAAATLRSLVQTIGTRAPETVLPIVLRTVERERDVSRDASRDQDARSHADLMLWLLEEVQDLYAGRPALHYDEPGEASHPVSHG